MGWLTTHAIERAKERYGLDLDQGEGHNLIQNAVAGRFLPARQLDGGIVYVGRCLGKPVIFLVAPDQKTIISFLPPDYFIAGSALRHAQKTRHSKQVSRTSVIAVKATYNRAKLKAETRNAGEGE